jgi:TetR/AcrR family transcriptional regulator, lmrAB and yxaGH operons repressor
MGRTTGTRARLVVGAVEALRERGLTGASFTEVLGRTGGPRGSLTHHFPGGKREMIIGAVRHASAAFVDAMNSTRDSGADAVTLAGMICDTYRQALIDSDYAAWCPVGAVAAEGHTDDALRAAAGAAFARWRAVLVDALVHDRHDADTATGLADLLISAVEGAALLARVERTTRPLNNAERHISTLLAPPR